MTTMATMLVLNLNPELEEDLIDYLLEQDSITEFTSYPVYSHGHHPHMSVAEQVTGRRKRVQVEILLDEASVGELLAELAGRVGRDISYREQPVHKHGRIG